MNITGRHLLMFAETLEVICNFDWWNPELRILVLDMTLEKTRIRSTLEKKQNPDPG